mgnify:CR=1 FL=1
MLAAVTALCCVLVSSDGVAADDTFGSLKPRETYPHIISHRGRSDHS